MSKKDTKLSIFLVPARKSNYKYCTNKHLSRYNFVSKPPAKLLSARPPCHFWHIIYDLPAILTGIMFRCTEYLTAESAQGVKGKLKRAHYGCLRKKAVFLVFGFMLIFDGSSVRLKAVIRYLFIVRRYSP